MALNVTDEEIHEMVYGRPDVAKTDKPVHGRYSPDERTSAYDKVYNEIFADDASAPPEPANNASLIDATGEGLKDFAAGTAAGIGGIAQWAGNRIGSESIAQAGDVAADYWEKKTGQSDIAQRYSLDSVIENPSRMTEANFWVYNTMQGLPSLTLSLVPGLGAASLLTKAAKAIKTVNVAGKAIKLTAGNIDKIAKIGGYIAGASVGGGLEGASTYRDVLKQTGDEQQASKAGMLMSAFSTGLNSISNIGILENAGKTFLKRLGKNVVVEGITEGLEQPAEVASKMIAGIIEGKEIPPDIGNQFLRSLVEGVIIAGPAGIAGGIGGSVFNNTKKTDDANTLKDLTETPGTPPKPNVLKLDDSDIPEGPTGRTEDLLSDAEEVLAQANKTAADVEAQVATRAKEPPPIDPLEGYQADRETYMASPGRQEDVAKIGMQDRLQMISDVEAALARGEQVPPEYLEAAGINLEDRAAIPMLDRLKGAEPEAVQTPQQIEEELKREPLPEEAPAVEGTTQDGRTYRTKRYAIKATRENGKKFEGDFEVVRYDDGTATVTLPRGQAPVEYKDVAATTDNELIDRAFAESEQAKILKISPVAEAPVIKPEPAKKSFGFDYTKEKVVPKTGFEYGTIDLGDGNVMPSIVGPIEGELDKKKPPIFVISRAGKNKTVMFGFATQKKAEAAYRKKHKTAKKVEAVEYEDAEKFKAQEQATQQEAPRSTTGYTGEERRKGEPKSREYYDKVIKKITNVEEAKKLAKELADENFTDPLTRLPNKAAWLAWEFKQDKLPEAKRDHIMIIDLDNFSWFNDVMGHPVGDIVLKDIGKILNEIAPGAFFRWGGEEFTAHNIDPNELTLIYEKVRDKLAVKEYVFDAIKDKVLADGTTYHKGEPINIKGLGVSRGIGKNLPEADATLQGHKDEKEIARTRAKKGLQPTGVRRNLAEGHTVETDINRRQAGELRGRASLKAQGNVKVGNENYRIVYRAVPLSSLIPSHNPNKNFAPDPRYPVGTQTRDYEGQKDEQKKVMDHAKFLDSKNLLSDTKYAIDGPPVTPPPTAKKRIVLAGNSRVQSLLLAKKVYRGKLKEYTDSLYENAPRFGVEQADITAIENTPLSEEDIKYIYGDDFKPTGSINNTAVMIREMVEITPRRGESETTAITRLVNEFNDNPAQALSPEAQAVAWGRLLRPETITAIGNILKKSNIESMAVFLDQTRAADVMSAMIDSGAIPENMRSKYVAAGEGVLTPEGKTAITAALSGAILKDHNLLKQRVKSNNVLRSFKNALPEIIKIMAYGDSGWNIIDDIRDGFILARRIKDSGLSIGDLTTQVPIGKEKPEQHTPKAIEIARALISPKFSTLRTSLNGYIGQVVEAGQGEMFATTPDRAFNQAFGMKPQETGAEEEEPLYKIQEPVREQNAPVTLYHVGVTLRPGDKMRPDKNGLVWFSDSIKNYGATRKAPITAISIPSDKILATEDANGKRSEATVEFYKRLLKTNGSKKSAFNVAESMGYEALQRGKDISMRPETADKYLTEDIRFTFAGKKAVGSARLDEAQAMQKPEDVLINKKQEGVANAVRGSEGRDVVPSDQRGDAEQGIRASLNQAGFAGARNIRLREILTGEQLDIQSIAKALGITAHFFETTDPDINRLGGVMLSSRPKDIFINVQNASPFIQIMGHEFSHTMQKNHPDLYGFVTDNIETLGFKEWVENLNAKYPEGKKLTDDKARAELIADFIGDQFLRTEFWNKLHGVDPTLTERLAKFLKSVVNRIRRIVTGADITEAERYIKELDRAREVVAKAISEAARRAAGQQGATTDEDAMFKIVHHGTPHVWPPEPGFPHGRPRLDKIGTGEGAAAYGWGWYSAENKDVAEIYKPNEIDTTFEVNDLESALQDEQGRSAQLELSGNRYSFVDEDGNNIGDEVSRELLDRLGRLNSRQTGSSTYTLDIPDEAMPTLFDWDKPLSEQSEYVKDRLQNDQKIKAAISRYMRHGSTIENAQDIYHALAWYIGKNNAQDSRGAIRDESDDKAASEYLASIGIPGNRYLDQGSRAAGKGTYNYVIWDQGVLDRVALLERNGEKLDAIREAQKDEGPRFSVKDTDSAYLAAVERGDMEAAQAMVDEAARAAGYGTKAYHGTTEDFNVFKIGDEGGMFFADEKWVAEEFGNRIVGAYLKMNNPVTVSYKEWISDSNSPKTDVNRLKKIGHDGIIITDYDPDPKGLTAYMVFDPSQIKSADPVVRNDKGEIIPLSERFNEAEEDIRFKVQATPPAFSETQRGRTPVDYQKMLADSPDFADDIKQVAGSFADEVRGGLDKYLGIVSTRIGNISEGLKDKLRRLDYDIGMRTKEHVEAIKPLLQIVRKKMTRDDRKIFDYARKNSDVTQIKAIVKKYGIEKEYAEYRRVLSEIKAAADDVGLATGKIFEYAPRILKDHRGFLAAIQKTPGWDDIYSRAIKKREEEIGLGQMTTEEKAELVSNMIQRGAVGRGGPSATKRRALDQIPAELNRYYMDSDSAMIAHIYTMWKAIEARKFFGKIPQRVAKIRTAQRKYAREIKELNYNMHGRLTDRQERSLAGYENAIRILEVRTDDKSKRQLAGVTKRRDILDAIKNTTLTSQQSAALRKKRNEYIGVERQLKDYLNKYAQQRDFKDNIGQYIIELMASGEIKTEDERTVNDILMARFHERGAHGIMSTYRSLAYIDTMGSPFSALTQIGDFPWAMFESGGLGLGGLKNIGKAILGKSRIKKEDVGISRTAQEFMDNDSLGRTVDWVFKVVQLERMDSIGKEALINSAFERYQKDARKRPKWLKAQLQKTYGDKADQLIQDLANDQITENVKMLVFSRLLDFQPAALSEVPQAYLDAGNGRIFYMLKTFTLKQLDVFRRECIQKMMSKDSATKIQGIKDLVRLSMFLVLANAGADWLKDWILGREVDLEDRVMDNALRLFGISKYITWQGRTEGYASAMIKQILPPVKFINSAGKDIATAGDGKGLEITASIPLVGKLAYWRVGRGADKHVDLWEQRLKKYKADIEDTWNEYQALTGPERLQYNKAHSAELVEARKLHSFQGRINRMKAQANKLKKSGASDEKVKALVEQRIDMIRKFMEKKS